MTTKIVYVDDRDSARHPSEYKLVWFDENGCEETINFGIKDSVFTIQSAIQEAVTLYKDDIPKLIKALNIAQEIIDANK